MKDISTEHRAMTRRLRKLPQDIYNSLNGTKVNYMHMAMGLAGESGEVVDLIKKHVINGHELDRDKLLEECGDALFYMVEILATAGFTIEDALAHSLTKLSARYPQGYSDEASIKRADVA